MEERRREYERYSPVFWRPAADAAVPHTWFLRRQIASDQTIALRTGHGFAICQRRPAEGFVDDFTVDSPGRWDTDGAELLLALAPRLAATGVLALRVVTAHADQPKCDLLRRLSLSVAEQWWVRELSPSGPPRAPGRFSGTGFSGLLTPAPPVYDPGGPVFVADQATADASAAQIARTAAGHGAVLAVIPPSRTQGGPGHWPAVGGTWPPTGTPAGPRPGLRPVKPYRAQGPRSLS